MGLDMFLFAKEYLSEYDEADKEKIDTIGEGPFGSKPTHVTYEVAYWRKCNQIHQWFVKNVQDGTDDCGEYFVQPSKLQELVNTCKEVLKDHTKAQELLPTGAGFFFGSTDYDEWYYEDIANTVKKLEPMLDDYCQGTSYGLYYCSSW